MGKRWSLGIALVALSAAVLFVPAWASLCDPFAHLRCGAISDCSSCCDLVVQRPLGG